MTTLEDVPEGHDPDIELIRPEDFLPARRVPEDAQRMGIDHYTGLDGAWLVVASALDGHKISHRLIAAALLVMFVGWPAFTVWQELRLP